MKKFYRSEDGQYMIMMEFVDKDFIRTTHFELHSNPDLCGGVNPKHLQEFIQFQKLKEIN